MWRTVRHIRKFYKDHKSYGPAATCNRPHSQLSVDKITKHTYICSKHFVSLDGPTDEFPDPCNAVTGETKRVRRRLSYFDASPATCINDTQSGTTAATVCEDVEESVTEEETGVYCQTEDTVFSAIEMLAYMSRIRQLEEENSQLRNEVAHLRHMLNSKSVLNSKSDVTVACQTSSYLEFSTANVSVSKIKNLFEFYTGLTYVRFILLLGYLFPSVENCSKNPIVYEYKRKETHTDRFPLSEQMFMYLCRLRNGLCLKDLAFRFNVKVQTVSTVINGVARYMYARLGALSFWPHRDVIIGNMTDAYRKDFPSCLAILDCTELKTEKPSSLKQQSQCYSDYKSSNTLKALVVCDPRGSILFVSDLFSGSISDNDIVKKSGFFDYLRSLKERGFIQINDNLMADKGFRIEKELSELEIGLNIPPFASSGKPFTEAEVSLTKKVASHRIHIERAINQIKCFKMLKRVIPISIFSTMNAHWFNAAMLGYFSKTIKYCVSFILGQRKIIVGFPLTLMVHFLGA